MRKLTKNSKRTLIVFTLFMIFLGILKIILLNSNGNVYGNRDAINKKVPIKKEEKSRIEGALKKEAGVKDVKTNVKVDRLNLIITVDSSVNLTKAKEIGNKTLSILEDKEKNGYDVEVFVVSENKDNKSFPIAGFRSKKCGKTLCERNECEINPSCDLEKCAREHKCNKKLSWTKDR